MPMSFFNLLLVIAMAWIGTVWPGAWTALLMLIGLAVLCFSSAYEHFTNGAYTRKTHRTG